MEVRLHVVQGKANVKEIVLGRETLIGRGAECNLKIASSQVSRRHCRIQVADQQVLVTDLGSANGTLLFGAPLTPQHPTAIDPAAELEIGPLRFAVHFCPQSVAPKNDDTTIDQDTARSDRPRAEPSAPSDSDTVDYIPDERRLRALREAVARSASSSAATMVAPGETVMDLNLSPRSPEEPEVEAFPSPPLEVERTDETILLPDEGIGDVAPSAIVSAADAQADDVVEEDDPALRAFLSDLDH